MSKRRDYILFIEDILTFKKHIAKVLDQRKKQK